MASLSPRAIDSQHPKENDVVLSSASSSSRLSNLSSSSRRPRHSPSQFHPHAAQRNVNEVASNPAHGTRSKLENALCRILYLPWLSVSDGDLDSHRASSRTRTQRAVRVLFFAWTWFCLAYFTTMLCGALRLAALRLRDTHSSSSFGDPLSPPDSMLATLSLEHRLSKLTSLYPDRVSVSPFVLGPRNHEDDRVVACLWTEDVNLAQLHRWASTWQGPISLLVTSPGLPRSPAHTTLLENMARVARIFPTVSFHLLHTPVPLHNFNAYINLARLFSPSSRVLLLPSRAIAAWSPLPTTSGAISSLTVPPGGGLIVPLRENNETSIAVANGTISDASRASFLSSSALLIDRDDAPWCSERLFTTRTRGGGTSEASTLDSEMAAHWEECVWNVWLRMKGQMHALDRGGWAKPGATPIAQLPPVPETVEQSVRVRVAQKQRSETCVIVARELVAQGLWTESDAEDGGLSNFVGPRERKSRRTESVTAQWLRSICKETLDRWGREILD